MARSQTWSNKPHFNTSGGQCPRLFVLQGDRGEVLVLWLWIWHRFVLLMTCVVASFIPCFSSIAIGWCSVVFKYLQVVILELSEKLGMDR